ncbi:Hypothetical protein BIBO2_0232 [Brucella sp. BO2]|uniref:hypothetical protein n=1 Tax=Brucella sp. BO2 TaxID=693750 RepID=UPI0001E44306|nr:hypothetical protein [Brucella sp. BO2]EFM60785.1 Hypothetical protein BIBO2_0232 [Brucella sp. BO2]
MRYLSAENYAALQAGQLVARDFLWLVARDRSTGALFSYGFWSDVGDVQAPMLNPNTGLAETRNFEGAGTLIQISDVPLVANLTIQTITIEMSQIDEAVNNIVRGYDLKQGQVEVYRGLFSPVTRQLVAPAVNRFIGYVDHIEINTPKEGDEGSVTLTCASHSQEFTRYNPSTRSHEDQKRRDPDDDFFVDASTVGEWEHFWGQHKGKVTSTGMRRIGINVRATNQ